MIDLTKPIEAVHPDGRVVPMELDCMPRHNSWFYTMGPPWYDTSNKMWNLDGTPQSPTNPWTIRNVAEPEPSDPDDWSIEEALKRGEWVDTDAADIREMASLGYTSYRCVLAFAHMIQRYQPELEPKPPVDPDVKAVREILLATATNGWDNPEEYRDGTYDKEPWFLAAVEAFKRVKGGVL